MTGRERDSGPRSIKETPSDRDQGPTKGWPTEARSKIPEIPPLLAGCRTGQGRERKKQAKKRTAPPAESYARLHFNFFPAKKATQKPNLRFSHCGNLHPTTMSPNHGDEDEDDYMSMIIEEPKQKETFTQRKRREQREVSSLSLLSRSPSSPSHPTIFRLTAANLDISLFFL